MGSSGPGAADCHFNIGIIYKKLSLGDRALQHLKLALEIRRKVVGQASLSAAVVLEQIGKFQLQKGDLKEAYDSLHECYLIRKKMLSKNGMSNSEDSLLVQRVSVLIMMLH